jgi:hypothetical protein
VENPTLWARLQLESRLLLPKLDAAWGAYKAAKGDADPDPRLPGRVVNLDSMD